MRNETLTCDLEPGSGFISIKNLECLKHNLTQCCTADNEIQSCDTKHDPKYRTEVIAGIVYMIGVLGNLTALYILCRIRSRPHNAKHRMMLRWLVINDLVALIGMLTLMILFNHHAESRHNKILCGLRVVMRGFGLYSGCVVSVMAIERYLALTKPFFYQKHVTIRLLKQSIIFMSLVCLTLVSLPLFGFGIYYKPINCDGNILCERYKMANTPKDKAYAYLYFGFGMTLLVCIIVCNIGVVKSLCFKGSLDPSECRKLPLVRKISRHGSLSSNSVTREEFAFGRLMLILCIVFFLCWFPQMISIPIAQFYGESGHAFYLVADLLMALHFVLDPWLYVMQRSRWSTVKELLPLSSSRNSSTKNSYLEACPLK